jgi:hypothetical protein
MERACVGSMLFGTIRNRGVVTTRVPARVDRRVGVVARCPVGMFPLSAVSEHLMGFDGLVGYVSRFEKPMVARA